MNAYEVQTAIEDVMGVWRWPAMLKSERKGWTILLANATQNDFDSALEFFIVSGDRRRPMASEFSARIRSVRNQAAKAAADEATARNTADLFDPIDDAALAAGIAECRQLLSEGKARHAQSEARRRHPSSQ
jgi:hypothetical protein